MESKLDEFEIFTMFEVMAHWFITNELPHWLKAVADK